MTSQLLVFLGLLISFTVVPWCIGHCTYGMEWAGNKWIAGVLTMALVGLVGVGVFCLWMIAGAFVR